MGIFSTLKSRMSQISLVLGSHVPTNFRSPKVIQQKWHQKNEQCPHIFQWDGSSSLQWCHNECGGVSNHQPHNCLLKRLFRCRSKKTSKLHVTGLCAGISPVTGEFPAKRASTTENVSIWWCHHAPHFSKPWQVTTSVPNFQTRLITHEVKKKSRAFIFIIFTIDRM